MSNIRPLLIVSRPINKCYCMWAGGYYYYFIIFYKLNDSQWYERQTLAETLMLSNISAGSLHVALLWLA